MPMGGGSGTVYTNQTPVHGPWPGVVPIPKQTSCLFFVDDVVAVVWG